MFDFFVDTALEASGVNLNDRKERKKKEKEEKKEKRCIIPEWGKAIIYAFGGLNILISLLTLMSLRFMAETGVGVIILNIAGIILTLLVIFFMWSGSYYMKQQDRDTARSMEVLGIVIGCIDLILMYAMM